MDITILKEIGLTEYESIIYLALLKHGQLSAYVLAEKTGLYRQVIYDSLNRLSEKGFVNSVKEGKSQIYTATSPEIILEYLNEKTERYRNLLPKLKSLTKQSQDKLVVETYKGDNVTRIALIDIINTLKKTGGVVLCTSVDESMPMSKHHYVIEQYERDMINYNIKERIIIKEGNKGLFKRGNSSYKKIPEKFFNPNPMQIYGNNVQIIVWGNPDYLTIIRSKDVADAYRKQFEFLWQFAKK